MSGRLITPHLYHGTSELEEMVGLLRRLRPAGRIEAYPGPADLRELMALPAMQANTRLWQDAQGSLVGFALVDPFDNLLFEVEPQALNSQIEAEIMAWGVERTLQAAREPGRPVTLDASCPAEDNMRIALLERNGFILQAESALRMRRSLTEPVPTRNLPPGFSIRCLAGEHEVEDYVALHRAAFGTENMTVEYRLAILHTPDYDPALDLVALAPDGRFAAFCSCQIRQEENAISGRNEGWTDPVGVHPAYRRLGLARALLLAGLRMLVERGMDGAVLGVSSQNLPMQNLAASVGFRVVSETRFFSRPLFG